jgi:FAD synthase
VWLQGPVVEGFQRGSRDLGFPTANVAPLSVEHLLAGRPRGVYFGFAQLRRSGSAASGGADSGDGGAGSGGDGAVAKMVLNYGVRPTMKNGSTASVRLQGVALRTQACAMRSCKAGQLCSEAGAPE